MQPCRGTRCLCFALPWVQPRPGWPRSLRNVTRVLLTHGVVRRCAAACSDVVIKVIRKVHPHTASMLRSVTGSRSTSNLG